ncbi:MAG: hypothetical protein HY392_03035 [Candidatus Diapherotrites archaeon]|nr:hypothetical protein [Candidatus Diapherotrites archaeon]
MNKVVLIGIAFFLAVVSFISFTGAYNRDFTGLTGDPESFGHSADELDVKVPDSDGEKMTLQKAIDEGFFGGEGGGLGDITAVRTPGGSGLEGGKDEGDVTLSLISNCGDDQILKFTGGAWICANDNSGGGGGVYSCAEGSSIRVLNLNTGRVDACEPDDVGGGGGNSFVTIDTPSGSDPQADSSSDTLNLTSVDGSLTITGNSSTDTIDFLVNATGDGVGYDRIQDESLQLTKRAILRFTGDGVTCIDSNPNTTCTIPGGGGGGDITAVNTSDLSGLTGGDDEGAVNLYLDVSKLTQGGTPSQSDQVALATGVGMRKYPISSIWKNCTIDGTCTQLYASSFVKTGGLQFDGDIVPNSEVCSNDQVLRKQATGEWGCSTAGLSCSSVQTSINNGSQGYADCDTLGTGYKVTGGGVNSDAGILRDSYPDMPNNRWAGELQNLGSGVVYAVCCKITWSG